jgi:hypothetical protein
MRNTAIATGLALAIAALFSLSQTQAAEPIKSEGKCFENVSNGNYAWVDCKKEASHKHKG